MYFCDQKLPKVFKAYAALKICNEHKTDENLH